MRHMKANLFSQRSLHLFHLLLPFLCHGVAANTEIINFSSSREQTVDLPWDVVGNWSKLHPSDNERQWTLELASLHTPLHQVCERDKDDENTVSRSSSDQPPFSCPHELWLLLDLDDDRWASYSTFTLRLSWPASTPADVAITLYTPQDLLARWSPTEQAQTTQASLGTPRHASTSGSSTPRTLATRSRYGRIRAVDAGVSIPGSRSHSPPRSPPPLPPRPPVPVLISPPDGDETPARSLSQSYLETGAAEQQGRRATVSFVVILEPLYLGVLPATLLPTVLLLVPVVLGAALVVARVTAYLEPFVRQARADATATARLGGTKKEC